MGYQQEILRPLLDSGLPVWAIAALVAGSLAVALFGVRRFLLSRLGPWARRTDNAVDDLFVEVIRRTRGWFLVLLSLIAGASVLPLRPPVSGIIHVLTLVIVGLQAGLWLTTLGGGVLRLWVGGTSADGASAKATLGALRFLVHLVVWSGVTLLVLANLGVDVTALVAGLGVGGVAVALAVQNILGDLFASLSIVLDQPFAVGDFIIVDDLMGTVERVGLKTTRVRSLFGEQLVFSNANLLGARIRNYQRMQERRIVFSVGVTYQTPPDLLKAIPGLIKDCVVAAPMTRFDRAHFKEFGDFALQFETVYYVLTPDYNRYMDIQQEINLGLAERFAERGIEFAYPTQTLYLERSGAGAGASAEPKSRPADRVYA
ncbi:MAG TPA: mechanosensitive ion channel family protein [Gemmatimonadales bacterium]|nr:mechanosensitive ion channel family protein [Gemmatimonadales bacterium]